MSAPENLIAELVTAEVAYRRNVRRQRPHLFVSTSNAYAEGLAVAVAILNGEDVTDVRARIRGELDRTEADGLAGADGARAELAARGV